MCVIVFLVAMAPRLVIWRTGTATLADQYWEISESILKKGEYTVLCDASNTSRFFARDQPTAIRTPATPFFIALNRLIFADHRPSIMLACVVLNSFVSVALLFMGRNLGSVRAGFLAGLAWALYPPAFIASYRTFFSEPLAIYCTVAVLWLIGSSWSGTARTLVLGVLMGLGILNRSEFLIAAILLMAHQAWARRFTVRQAGFALAVAAALVSPWVVRNALVMGGPTLSTHDGFNFWIGNNPWSHGAFDNDVDAWGFERSVEDTPQMRYVSDRYPDIWETDELTRSSYFKAATKDYLRDLAMNDPLTLVYKFFLKGVFTILQPGELLPLVSGKFRWDPSPRTLLPFVARLLIKIACVLLILRKRPSAAEFALLIPFIAILIVQMMAFPLPRYEVPSIFGPMLFVCLRLLPPAQVPAEPEQAATGEA